MKAALSRKPAADPLSAEKRSNLRKNLKNLRPFVFKHWRKGVLGAVLILLSTLLGLPVPLITRYLIDEVILSRQLNLLLGIAALLAAVKLIGMFCGVLQRFYFSHFERKVLLDIQQHLVDRTLRLPKSFFDTREVGYLMSRLISDVHGLQFFFSSTLVHILGSLLRFTGGAFFLFYLNWRLALAVLFLLPLLVVGIRFFGRRVRLLSHHGMEQQALVSRYVQESLSTAPLIKAFSTEDRTSSQVGTHLRKALQIGMENTSVQSAAGLLIGLLPEISRFIVLLAGAYWVITGQWSLGSMLAFLAYIGYVYGPAQFLAGANLNLQSAVAALERVSTLFDIVPEENLDSGTTVERVKGEVEFRDVSFSYNGREKVLENISFHAAPGEWLAIVGPSGVGKTTLISMILSFYRPSGGEIYFDGRPVSDYNLGSLRRRIGYVSQKPQLLSGSVMENLRYGNTDVETERIKAAARLAGIHEFIMELPHGYESTVGEGGVNLSTGQVQRLALARALAKAPDILILDEPTSALDKRVERSIFDSLPEVLKDKTLFIVAHQPATIKLARRVLLLNENRLIAVSTHRELLKSSAYYRSLFDG